MPPIVPSPTPTTVFSERWFCEEHTTLRLRKNGRYRDNIPIIQFNRGTWFSNGEDIIVFDDADDDGNRHPPDPHGISPPPRSPQSEGLALPVDDAPGNTIAIHIPLPADYPHGVGVDNLVVSANPEYEKANPTARGFAELQNIAMPEAVGAASLETDAEQREISQSRGERVTALLEHMRQLMADAPGPSLREVSDGLHRNDPSLS